MTEFIKGKFVTILVVSATIILAGVAIFTAVRLYQLRNQSVSPTAPEQPKASTIIPPACKSLVFNLNVPTTTVTPSPTSQPNTTSTPVPTQPSNPGAPQCTADKPAATTITSLKRSQTKAILTWNKVNIATHYTISYGIEPGKYIYGVPNTGNVTTYTIDKLDPSKKYYFIVYAVNDCMPSKESQPVGAVASASDSEFVEYAAGQNLPNAGVSLPTYAGIGIGILIVAAAIIIAL